VYWPARLVVEPEPGYKLVPGKEGKARELAFELGLAAIDPDAESE